MMAWNDRLVLEANLYAMFVLIRKRMQLQKRRRHRCRVCEIYQSRQINGANHTLVQELPLFDRVFELSKHVWMLKDSNKDYKVVWCIVARAPPYKSGSGRCALCLTEKSVIIRANPRGLLNNLTELISKCRHRNKYLA